MTQTTSGTMQNFKVLSVIVPVYNEEKTVYELLSNVLKVSIPDVRIELIVVDDGSTDGSAAAIRLFFEQTNEKWSVPPQFILQSNMGKGGAVRTGVQHSHGDVVIIQDADLEYDPENYAVCIAPILNGKYQVVYGSRQESDRNRAHSSPFFYFGGLTLTFIIDLLFHAELTDEPTCYKTFRGDLIRNLEFEGNRFDWEPEVTQKILRLGLSIKEVPIDYHPRTQKDGKKIQWKDGIIGILTALKWKYMNISPVRNKLLNLESDTMRDTITEKNKERLALLCLVFCAVMVRIAFAYSGIKNPCLLMREDSQTYIGPQLSLWKDGCYNTFPSSGIPALVRVPGYPVYLMLCFAVSKGSYVFCIIMSCILGGFLVVPVYRITRLYTDWKRSWFISQLTAFNITAIAYSPMFLSDSLFALFVAYQTLFFLSFFRTKFGYFLFQTITVSAFAAFIRPINVAWTVPCIFIVFLLKNIRLSDKMRYAAGAIFLASFILFPWVIRNHSCGGGWRFDGISADRMKHEAAAVQGKAENRSIAEIKQQYMQTMEREFQLHPERYPDMNSKFTWQENAMRSVILKHPFIFLKLHFQPLIAAPDVPVLLENMEFSKSGKNTLDIVNRYGILAGVKHYFNGSYIPLLYLSPLLLCVFIFYVLAFCGGICFLMKYRLIGFLVISLFAGYYLVLPGILPLPRFHICVLPFISFLAAYLFYYKQDNYIMKMDKQTR